MVAPCFESATEFSIAVVEDGRIILSRQIVCGGCKGFSRVNLLKENSVTILICSGINRFYQNLLSASDIRVISSVNTDADEAIDLYLSGKLNLQIFSDDEIGEPTIPLDDLVCWSKDIFSTSGFRIYSDEERTTFPIDFLAEINCPLCGKLILLAVCCGAHAYKAEHELVEFKRVSRSPIYNARIYIHPSSVSIKQRCDEFGIELIDPFDESLEKGDKGRNIIPLLRMPIIGHERASSQYKSDVH